METQTTNARPRADAGKRPVLLFRDTAEGKPTLRQVFEAEESPLLRFAYGLVGQRETAEDLVQDAFLKLHAHWHEVNPHFPAYGPSQWLFQGPPAESKFLAVSHNGSTGILLPAIITIMLCQKGRS